MDERKKIEVFFLKNRSQARERKRTSFLHVLIGKLAYSSHRNCRDSEDKIGSSIKKRFPQCLIIRQNKKGKETFDKQTIRIETKKSFVHEMRDNE